LGDVLTNEIYEVHATAQQSFAQRFAARSTDLRIDCPPKTLVFQLVFLKNPPSSQEV
jgi:hypothetical protein